MGYPRVINIMCVEYSSQELETGKGKLVESWAQGVIWS